MGLPRPLHLLLLSKLLHLFVRQLLFNSQLTMTMLIHQWTPTSTHSSTPTTQLTVTSNSTEMEPTLDPTMPTTLLTVSQTVLTVLVLTLSSIPLMLLTNKRVCSLVTRPVFSSSGLLLAKCQFSSLASNSQLNQLSKLSLLRLPHLQGTSSLQVNSS